MALNTNECLPGAEYDVIVEECCGTTCKKAGFQPSATFVPAAYGAIQTKLGCDPASDAYEELVDYQVPAGQRGYTVNLDDNTISFLESCTINDNGNPVIQGDFTGSGSITPEFKTWLKKNKCVVFDVFLCTNCGVGIMFRAKLNSFNVDFGIDSANDNPRIEFTLTNENEFGDYCIIDVTKGTAFATLEELIEDIVTL